MSRKISRRNLYLANLDPVRGSEQGGIRPVLIIQNNVGNQHSPTVIVAALSGRTFTKANLPTHYLIKNHIGIREESLVLLEQIRTIDKMRLKQYLGKLTEKDMEAIDHCLAISLELKIA